MSGLGKGISRYRCIVPNKYISTAFVKCRFSMTSRPTPDRPNEVLYEVVRLRLGSETVLDDRLVDLRDKRHHVLGPTYVLCIK